MAARRYAVVAALSCLLPGPPAAAEAVLREARLVVSFNSPTTCQVAADFTVDAADGSTGEVEHRVHVLEGASVTLTDTEGGARVAGPPLVVGRSLALRLELEDPGVRAYGLRYQVAQPEAGAYRCPIWLPTTPTDGRSQEIWIHVNLPAGAVPVGGGLPALAWEGNRGTVRVAHVPAFVRVPFRLAGEPSGVAGFNVTRLMDAVAIGVLACGTALFAWRRRRR
jgi:hypothetical protein